MLRHNAIIFSPYVRLEKGLSARALQNTKCHVLVDHDSCCPLSLSLLPTDTTLSLLVFDREMTKTHLLLGCNENQIPESNITLPGWDNSPCHLVDLHQFEEI